MNERKTTSLQALILAAGKGTRMNSDLPKVLHRLANKPMIEYVLESSLRAGIENITVVVGHAREMVEKTVMLWNKENSSVAVEFQFQEQQNGTGHAVLCAREKIQNIGDYLIVLLGDVPLIKPETIEKAYASLTQNRGDMLVITTSLENPHGYGRIIRDDQKNICCIREEKEASLAEKSIKEINTGVFLFKNTALWSFIDELNAHNAQNEYYLTDLVEIMKAQNQKVLTYECSDSIQFQGINSPDQLASLEKLAGVSV
ncbi:MAG: NTP transferase domain-containing protein [Spirochaetia bacterium]|nr:NTP transferase domain-containing protein [Spirochaetia bacterium]